MIGHLLNIHFEIIESLINILLVDVILESVKPPNYCNFLGVWVLFYSAEE